MSEKEARSRLSENQGFRKLLSFLVCNQSVEGMETREVEELQGEIYEKTRYKLIRLFRWRGSEIPEELVDQTFERVSKKLPDLTSYVGDPTHYICGVARLIFLESLRHKDPHPPMEARERDENEDALECLDECMHTILQPLERELILEYYRSEKRAKIDRREKIAAQLGISVNSLRIKTCRIRRRLRKCVTGCLKLK